MAWGLEELPVAAFCSTGNPSCGSGVQGWCRNERCIQEATPSKLILFRVWQASMEGVHRVWCHRPARVLAPSLSLWHPANGQVLHRVWYPLATHYGTVPILQWNRMGQGFSCMHQFRKLTTLEPDTGTTNAPGPNTQGTSAQKFATHDRRGQQRQCDDLDHRHTFHPRYRVHP